METVDAIEVNVSQTNRKCLPEESNKGVVYNIWHGYGFNLLVCLCGWRIQLKLHNRK